MPVVGCWTNSKKLTFLSGLPHLSFIHGGADRLWARRRGRRSRRAAARSREGEELSSNPSSAVGRRGSRIPSWSWAPRMVILQGHSSVRRRRGRPPQVGVRHGPGASISEAAWLPIERDPSVTTEAAELWSRAGSSTAVLNASAVTAPTPGTVIERRHTWSYLVTASMALCSNASWLMTAARVCEHASSPLRVPKPTFPESR